MAWNSKRRSAVLVCLLLQAHWATPSQEIMKKLTTGFSKALETCKEELSLGDHIIQDFFNYWREEYDLVNKDMGCAIICMASKLDLITDDMKLHHGNAHEFAKSHGAVLLSLSQDDDMAKQLVGMIHECEKTQSAITDECMKMLEIAKCFRTKIHDLKWAPSMETILEEIMTAV